MSSAEEESVKRQAYKTAATAAAAAAATGAQGKIRRKKQQQQQQQSSSSSSASSLQVPQLPVNVVALPDDHIQRMKLREISELFSEHEYMKNSATTGRPVCSHAALKSDLTHHARRSGVKTEARTDTVKQEEEEEEKKKNERKEEEDVRVLSSLLASAEQTAAMHTQQIAVKVWEVEAFVDDLARVPQPAYFLDTDDGRQIDTKVIQHQLREGRVDLLEQRAEHESEILGQAGDFKLKNGRTYHFPKCMNQSECVAAKGTPLIAGLTEPIILMGFMFKHEYDHFLKTGKPPAGDRPCVLCCRYLPARLTLDVRGIVMRGGDGLLKPHDTRPYEKKQVQIVQCYRNLEDQEGGYFRDYMFHSQLNEPTIEPIVKLNKERLRAYRDSSNGRWMIDQSALVFDKAMGLPQAKVGETLQSFSTGVRLH